MSLYRALLISMLLVRTALAQPSLESSFRHPPASAKPWTFWYWMQAAVSKEGVRADLVAMKQAGIGGAYLMPIQGPANPPLYTPVVRQLSPAWWDMVRYAMQEADSLGLKLAMHDCDGFAVAGGPWITPELSMQKVVWIRTAFDGGRVVSLTLPQPETIEKYYRDIAVLAFPTPAGWDASTRTIVPKVITSTGADAQFLVQNGPQQTGIGVATAKGQPIAKSSFGSSEPCWIQYNFDQPFTCRSITIHAANNYQAQRLLVEVSDDGVDFRSIGRLIPPRHGWQDGDAPVTHSIASITDSLSAGREAGAVTARCFRFVYDKTGSEPGAEDLDAAKWKPSLKISGIELSAAPSIDQFEGKAGEVWRVSGTRASTQPGSLNTQPGRVNTQPGRVNAQSVRVNALASDPECIDPRTIIDLSGKTDAGGHLQWQAPNGHWTILRIGHTSTGHTNATGGDGKGLECDKFNPRTVEYQFDHWFGETIRQVGPALAGKVLKIFHVDSWECGSQNWSPVFREEFRRRRGYDLLTWLPAMTGIPIGTMDSSERFLHDIRQTIAELLHDEFYATMARLAHAKGCSFSAESVAPTMTSDALLHYSEADLPMGEFWLRSPTHDKPNDMLDAISGAHLYGKPLIQAEAFTELRLAWDEDPAMLKVLQDYNYALGVNRMVFHVFTHNPWMDRKPGMTLGAGVGNFLQRDQTWWAQGKAWIDYTQRCQWLLQQGRPVVDLAVFTGEEIPRRAVLPERLVTTLPGLFGPQKVRSEQLRLANTGEPTTKLPNGVSHSANMADPADFIDPLHGYAFDSFNPDALLRLAKVRNGRVEMPGGASYALLVLPAASPLSPDPGMISAPVAQRLLRLVNDGATLLIDPPPAYPALAKPSTAYHSTGLSHAAGDDLIVRQVFHQLLDGTFDSIKTHINPIYMAHVGKGRVIKGPYEAASLHPLGIAPDFVAGAPDFVAGETGVAFSHGQWTPGSSGVAYTHRAAPGLDIYFVSNQTEFPRHLQYTLRVSGREPEIWDPLTGDIQRVKDWTVQDGRTSFRAYMAPHGSFFIVLRQPATPPARRARLKEGPPAAQQLLSGAWTVRFDTASGGPAAPVIFDSLQDWSHHADSSIRYYSGTAIYTKVFDFAGAGASASLDLGQVANIATVKLNGVDCGTAWTPPYKVDISKALRKGKNELQIAVTNTWANRLTGDQRLPEPKRITWTTAPYRLDGKLLTAGLLGPVKIEFSQQAH